MKLHLDLPSSWRPTGDDAWTLDGEPAITLHRGRLGPRPLELDATVDGLLRLAAPAGLISIAGHTEWTTRAGWPATEVRARVHDAAGDLVETRVVVVYTFLDHAGALIVRCAGGLGEPARWRPVVESGRPAWGPGAPTLAALFEGFTPSPPIAGTARCPIWLD